MDIYKKENKNLKNTHKLIKSHIKWIRKEDPEQSSLIMSNRLMYLKDIDELMEKVINHSQY